MLEYNYTEAHELLTKSLTNAQLNLKSLQSDLDFLKDQITISEVNIARIHNYNVQLKKEAREKEAKNGGAAAPGTGSTSTTGRFQQVGTIPMQ